jgi:hypothetical protein
VGLDLEGKGELNTGGAKFDTSRQRINGERFVWLAVTRLSTHSWKCANWLSGISASR